MPNPKVKMQAELEAKFRQKYGKKLAEMKAEFTELLAQAKARYLQQLDIALQQSSDAALMAIDDVFDVNEYSAEKFHVAHIQYVNQMASLMVDDYEDDKTMTYTKADIDRRLRQIVGEENFVPFEERYGKKDG